MQSAEPVRGEHSPVKIIHAAYIVPVRPHGVVLEDHAAVVSEDVILAVLPIKDALAAYPSATVVDLPEHVLLPGLINMHTHSPMTLLRGYADDMALQTWLGDHIWPAEQRFVSEAFVADGTRLAVAEMLRAGTTCFNDMYFHPEAISRVCRETGIRASIGVPLIEQVEGVSCDLDRFFADSEELHDQFENEPLLSSSLAPHAPYTVSDQALVRIEKLSRQLDIPVHMHLLETAWETRHSMQHYECHPLARLKKCGLLNSRLQAVHLTQVTEADISLLADSSVQVIHCPQSNLKLASGISPVSSMLDAGVNVSLGTDGAASNNDLDLLDEAQTAALLAKGMSGDAEAVGAFQALEMLTINGARALGREDSLGTIEPGKQADLCAIDLASPETQPMHNVVSQLIYAASAAQVTDVWVAGRRLLSNRVLTTIDLKDTISRAGTWKVRLAEFKQQPTADQATS